MFTLVSSLMPTAAAGTIWDVFTNITNDIVSHFDTSAKLVGAVIFTVGIFITAWGIVSSARRASKLIWGITALVIGASLMLAGFTGILNNMFQNTGKEAVAGLITMFVAHPLATIHLMLPLL